MFLVALLSEHSGATIHYFRTYISDSVTVIANLVGCCDWGLLCSAGFALRYYMWRREYSRWCAVVNEAKIRWVKVEALRRWHRNGQHIPRMQDLVRGDYVDVAYGTWRKDRNRFVISHAWLSAGEPDPMREQLKALVAELDRLAALDTDVVFYDYASIPQVPRTEEQTQQFKIALQNMNLLYTLEGTRVLVIPQVPKTAPNPTPYCDRGWCFFEIAVSSACSTIFNYESSAVIELLERYKFPLSSPEFRTAFAETKFTVKGDREKVEILYDGFLAQGGERKTSTHSLSANVVILLFAFILGHIRSLFFDVR